MKNETIQEAFDLIRKGGADQMAGIELLYQDCWNDFRAWCIRRGMSLDHAEDVASEAYLKIFKSITNFKGESTSSLCAWLWMIVRNSFYDKIEYLKKLGEYELSQYANENDDSEVQIPDPNNWEDQFDSAKDCYDKYIKEYQKAYYDCAIALDLAAIQQFSYEELSVVINRSNAASREFVSQCKKKLVSFMEHCRDYIEA